MTTTRTYGRQALLLAALLTSLFAEPVGAAKSDDDVEEVAPKVGEGQTQKTLAERIPAVTHRAFSKRHRVELMPSVGLSLNDPFYRYVMPGVGLNYYILETLSVGASADYYAGIRTTIPVVGGAVRSQVGFNKPNLGARLQVTWLPLYGKISWLAERVLHFDTYATLSLGAVVPQSGGTSLSVSLAIGQHYFLNDWIALRLEVRDEFFELVRDPSINATRELQSLLTASLGLCFYLPQEGEPED